MNYRKCAVPPRTNAAAPGTQVASPPAIGTYRGKGGNLDAPQARCKNKSGSSSGAAAA